MGMNVFRCLGLLALLGFFAYHLDPDDVPGLGRWSGGARIETISRGEEVDVTAHLAASGRTVVEFTADW